MLYRSVFVWGVVDFVSMDVRVVLVLVGVRYLGRWRGREDEGRGERG